MSVAVSVDMRGLQKQLQEMAKLRGDTIKPLKDTARQIASDCIRMTPPFGKAVSTESFNTQRDIGRKAVERDIRRTMVPLDSIRLMSQPDESTPEKKRLGATIRRLRRAGDWKALSEIIGKLLQIHDLKIAGEADAKFHIQHRTRRGRVERRNVQPVLINRAASIKAYIKKEQDKVGLAKSGWSQAVAILGVKRIPSWITSQNGQGTCIDATGNKLRPYITFSNDVPFIQESGRELSITRRACANRERNLAKEIQRLTDARVRKANASK